MAINEYQDLNIISLLKNSHAGIYDTSDDNSSGHVLQKENAFHWYP